MHVTTVRPRLMPRTHSEVPIIFTTDLMDCLNAMTAKGYTTRNGNTNFWVLWCRNRGTAYRLRWRYYQCF
jgi:hypothetical protein